MLVLRRGQRELLADTLKDFANIAAGAMIFGQFLGEQPFSISVGFVGFLVWIVFVTYAVRLQGWIKD